VISGKTGDVANSQRRRRFQTSKPIVRAALLYAGAAALVSWVILLGIAVYTEPASIDFSGTWLAVATIAAALAVVTVLSLLVTHPGWISGVAGGAAAIIAAVGAFLIYITMPEPSVTAFITHRHALAALAFGFGVIGGGLLVLAEMVTEGKVPTRAETSKWAPSLGVGMVVIVLVAAGFGVPTMHRWADSANTEASFAQPSGQVAEAKLLFEETSEPMNGKVVAATPGGVLTVDNGGKGSAVAVTMRDAASGTEQWHHRRWNREALQPPVLTADGTKIGLVGKRRDDTTLQHLTILDSYTGRVQVDIPFDGPPGELELMTDEVLVYFTGAEQQSVAGRDLSGRELWNYEVPIGCVATTTTAVDDVVAVALACRADDGSKEEARVVALNATSGRDVWDWIAAEEGRIYPGGMVAAPEKLIVDVRRDESPNDSLFAARMYRHDLNAITVEDGETDWRNKDLDLGNTYAPACVGTLQVAGVSPDGDDLSKARVLIGECHQLPGTAGATMDIAAYSIEGGNRVLRTQANMGYSPTRDEDTTGWFMGLPDGRVLMTVDGSLDINAPDCRLFIAGPSKKNAEAKRLPVPDSIKDSGWCRQAALGLSPAGVTVGYTLDDQSRYFSLS